MSSNLGKRLKTISVLIDSSSAARGPLGPRLLREQVELETTARLSGPRRELLQVIHTARLLEGFLAAIVDKHLIPFPGPRSLGSYLKGLRDHNRTTIKQLPPHRQLLHRRSVVDIRNVYMHTAGAFPTKKQADELLSSMHVCVADVAGLE